MIMKKLHTQTSVKDKQSWNLFPSPKIISEAVMNILNEIGDTPKGQKLLGMAARRAIDNRDNAKARNIKQYSDDRREEDAKKMSGKSQWRQNRRAKQMQNSVTDGFFGKDSSVGIYRDKE